jgi:hypothetical protein
LARSSPFQGEDKDYFTSVFPVTASRFL